MNIDRYIRYGYLQQDDNDQMYLDWRTRAEVDEKALIDLLLKSETQPAIPPAALKEENEENENKNRSSK